MWEPIWMGLYSLNCTMLWFAPCETQTSLVAYFQKFGLWEQQET